MVVLPHKQGDSQDSMWRFGPPFSSPYRGVGGDFLFFRWGNSSGILKKFTEHYVVNRYFASIFKLKKKSGMPPHNYNELIAQNEGSWTFFIYIN